MNLADVQSVLNGRDWMSQYGFGLAWNGATQLQWNLNE
jgi:hypothetical protein